MPLMTSDGTDRFFSPEVFDIIIDHIHSDKTTVLSCSTVCRSWLPRCRYHLFHDIDLTPALVEFLCSSPDALHTIVPYIKNITLGDAWSLARREDYDRAISLLLNLTSVHGIAIETWSWDFAKPTFRGLILDAEGALFRNISRLHLQYIRFPSFSALTTLIDKFSVLEDLSFDNVIWELVDSNNLSISNNVQPLRRLKKLSIRSSQAKPILAWLFGGEDFMQAQEDTRQVLHSITLPDLLSSDIGIVGCLLRTLGLSLRHLEVGYFDPISPDTTNFFKAIDLSHNQSLRTLRLHHLNLYQFPPHDFDSSLTIINDGSQVHPLSWVIPLLSNVPPSLVELALDIWLSQEAQLDFLDWKALSSVLAGPHFEGLRSLQFRVMGLREGKDDFKGWLFERLSSWRASRNVVQAAFL
ncbi:hypothetical protein C0995_001847 [Termitomyces sp. Mi166|nr:hypothetical protein C0995_001847 [Termitomyces sp. Mi166\